MGNHKFYIQHRDEIRKKSHDYYLTHQDEARRKKNEHSKQVKLEIISHYSFMNKPMCIRCGESDIDVLCVDHINGNGNAHRRQINVGGNSFYNWLRKNNYPDGFQILCYNCNMKKAIREKK